MPTKAKGMPSAESLLEIASGLFADAKDRNVKWDALDDLYDQKEPDGRPDGVQIVKTAKATNVVDLAADLAAQQELNIEVPAASESEKSQKAADAQERWFRAWLEANEEAQGINMTDALAFLATMRSVCVSKVLFIADNVTKKKAGDTEDEQEEAYTSANVGQIEYQVSGLPIVMRACDPRNIVTREGPTGIHLVAERYKRSCWEVKQEYPGALADDDRYPDETDIMWTEVWTKDYCAYYAADEPIKVAGKAVRAHGYGCIPYAFGTARRRIRASGVQYRPLLEAVKTNVKNMDTWLSILGTSGWAAVTSAWGVFSDNYTGDGGKTLDTTPGAVNYFSKQDSVQPIQKAALPEDFFRLGEVLQNDFQQATFPTAMFGEVGSGMAGYAISMLTQSGRRVLAPIWHAVESCYASAFRICAMIARNKVAPLVGEQVPLMIAQDMEAGKRRIKNKLLLDTTVIGDDWSCKVKLGDPMPQDQASNLRMALEASGGDDPLLSKDTARTKFMVIEDSADEQDKIEVERIVKQLAPLEAVKLAQARGYIPRKIEMPAGWKMNEQGQVVPDLEEPQEMMEQEDKDEPQTDPLNPAMLQTLSGQPQGMPDMGQLAGEPPMPPMMGGF